MYRMFIINLFLIFFSTGNQASFSEKALYVVLNHYTNDFNFNDVKAKYEQIPVDLRSLIKANMVARGKSNLANSLFKDFQRSLKNRLNNITVLVSSLTNENRFSIEYSLEAASTHIWPLDAPRYACIPDSAKPHIQKCRDTIAVKQKDFADTNRIESDTSNSLYKAYASSSRDMDSDRELYTSTTRFKIEFEDFLKESGMQNLLESCRFINTPFFSKRFAGEFDSKTMKIPNFVLVNTPE